MSKNTSVTPFSVAGVVIHQDADGRFCLNDLHKAAGGEPRHAPALWERQASELIEELAKDTKSYGLTKKLGRNGGTYSAKELVYAYANWISAPFWISNLNVPGQVQGRVLAVCCCVLLST